MYGFPRIFLFFQIIPVLNYNNKQHFIEAIVKLLNYEVTGVQLG